MIEHHFSSRDCADTIRQVTAASPSTKVLVPSADPHADGVPEALRAGASGYLRKTRGITALTEAISRILRDRLIEDLPAA